jgi:hypothetical protein
LVIPGYLERPKSYSLLTVGAVGFGLGITVGWLLSTWRSIPQIPAVLLTILSLALIVVGIIALGKGLQRDLTAWRLLLVQRSVFEVIEAALETLQHTSDVRRRLEVARKLEKASAAFTTSIGHALPTNSPSPYSRRWRKQAKYVGGLLRSYTPNLLDSDLYWISRVATDYCRVALRLGLGSWLEIAAGDIGVNPSEVKPRRLPAFDREAFVESLKFAAVVVGLLSALVLLIRTWIQTPAT